MAPANPEMPEGGHLPHDDTRLAPAPATPTRLSLAIEDRLFVAGTNHRTAPVSFREKLALRADIHPVMLRDLLSCGLEEVVLLSTCNRFEVYGVVRQGVPDVSLVAPAVRRQLGVDIETHLSALYIHRGGDVTTHLLRVAASLDSQVLGESQILGQVKEAHRLAVEAASCGKILNRLFHKAVATGKRVRTETKIGHNAVSVSYAAVELAKKIFGRLDGRRALVVGVGEMSGLVAQHLKANGVSDMTITNRTLQGAVTLADRFAAQVVEFDRFPTMLDQIDILLTATGASAPIIGVAQIERALALRRQRPLFMIDLAVPRDIEAAVGDLPNAYLFNIDDLQMVADQNYKNRVKEARRAEALVTLEAAGFLRWLKSLRAAPLIERIQAMGQELVGQEQGRLENRLSKLGERDRQALLQALSAVVAKVLHRPMVNLKRLAQDEDADVWFDTIEELFFGKSGDGSEGSGDR